MPLDPQVQILLDQLATIGGPDVAGLSVAEARALNGNLTPLAGPIEEVAATDDLEVPGPEGPVAVRLYRPATAAPSLPTGALSPQPLLVWFHGGGWVLGDLDATDATARRLSNGAGALVASVDYPLAPEHRYPVQPLACHTVTRWLAGRAAALGADPARVAVGGDSAGGNLAAVTALLARDRGGPPLCFQLLVYPATDLLMSCPSIVENGDGRMLTRAGLQWFRSHYLGEDEAAAKEPMASPLYADDLAGLPPALVITAELDPLRDEGEAYGRRLQEAGVAAKISRYDGQIHGFFGMTLVLDGAGRAVAEAIDALRAAFGTVGST